MSIKKQITDSPLIDEIVYQCQTILKDIVIKNESEADKFETLQTVKNADFYSIIIEGKATFEMFNYTYPTLSKIPSLTPNEIYLYANNNALIPEGIRPALLKIATDDFLSNYQELNNYYRMLQGLPYYGYDGIRLTPAQISRIDINFNTSKYIHEMDSNEIHVLDSYGIIDELIEEHPEPEFKYLNHLGDKRVDPYIARHASNFSALYVPGVESTEVYNKFKERYEINRVYFLKTIYTEAYKFNNDNFDKFIIILMLIQTLDDMVVLSPEYIISRDLFDLRTIQYVFEANGVEFFKEIPLKYQKRLLKNLNRLIKYRSTDKNLVDIISLFGFDDIQLFKYYLFKQPILNDDGTYKHDTCKDPISGKEIEDVEANYKLNFLKVPMQEIADEYIKDKNNFYSYEDITGTDIYWNGIYDSDYVKRTILQHEFNMCISKYISVESLYSLTELSFELVYFINMIMYSKVDTSKLLIDIPEISTNSSFPLIDVLITLYSLMYMYNGVEDEIMYDPVQVLAVKGFNFDVDMNKLASYVAQQSYTLKDLGVDEFQNVDSIVSFGQLLNVYTKNKNIYNHLVHEINNANDKQIYDIYTKIYESLMITNAHFDYYKKYSTGGTPPKTYSQCLNIKNSQLYSIILECKNITKISDRQDAISKYINYLVEDIYVFLDKNTFRYIFHNIPTVSIDYVRLYLFKVLNFFKSYKVDVIRSNIIYKFDDRFENKINIIDQLFYKFILSQRETLDMADLQQLLIKFQAPENVGLLEKIYIDLKKWSNVLGEDFININEKIVSILMNLIKNDFGNLSQDSIYEMIRKYEVGFSINCNEDISNLQIDATKKDIFRLLDRAYFDYKKTGN